MLRSLLAFLIVSLTIALLTVIVSSCSGKNGYKLQNDQAVVPDQNDSEYSVMPVEGTESETTESDVPLPFAEETEQLEGVPASELPEEVNRDASAARLNAPTNIVAWDGTYNDRCRVTWEHPAGEQPSVYYVYRSTTASNPNPTYIGGRSYPGRIFDDTTAVPGTHYYYKVKSHKVAFADSYFSSEDVGWRNDRMNAPTNVTASDGTYNDKVYVYWTHPGGEAPACYYIYRSESSGDPNPIYVGVRSYPGRTFEDTTSVPGTKYWYLVKSHKAGFKDSYFSNEHRGWRKAKLNEIPQIKATDGYYMDKVKVRWEDTSGVQPDIYYVYRSESWNGEPVFIGGATAPNMFYFDHTALPDQTYYYNVRGHKDGYEDSPFGWQNAGWLGEWTSEIVDNSSGSVGFGCSQLYSYMSGSYISYVDAANGYLKYTYHNPDTWEWTNETVDSSGGVAQMQTSLQMDSNGYPCISYCDFTNNYLKYASFDGTDWSIETVDNSGEVCSGTSLSLYWENDYPSIAYVNVVDDSLNYASFDGTDWNLETVDDTVEVLNTSVSLASIWYLWGPCIAYVDLTNGYLKFAYFDESTWVIETVDDSGQVLLGQFSMVIGDVGYPKIAYKSDDDLKYADWDGSNWNLQTVGTNRNPDCISLALGSDWNPHISYQSLNTFTLKYTRFNGTSWETMTADDTSANVGYFSSLVIDKFGTDDYPLISHYDATNGCLRLVKLG